MALVGTASAAVQPRVMRANRLGATHLRPLNQQHSTERCVSRVWNEGVRRGGGTGPGGIQGAQGGRQEGVIPQTTTHLGASSAKAFTYSAGVWMHGRGWGLQQEA